MGSFSSSYWVAGGHVIQWIWVALEHGNHVLRQIPVALKQQHLIISHLARISLTHF